MIEKTSSIFSEVAQRRRPLSSWAARWVREAGSSLFNGISAFNHIIACSYSYWRS